MNLQELLAQPLAERDHMVAKSIEDREITRDDVRAVAASKSIRQRTPAMKSVDVVVVAEEWRDDNYPDNAETRVIRVNVVASSNGGAWSSRCIETTIPMVVGIDPYKEISVECDDDRKSECVLRSTGRDGDDEMIDLPTFGGTWIQCAAGKALLREWLTWNGAASLVANAVR